ncbi:zinc finger matrin-type protein 3 [Bactrocera dorsalis]|uniref:Zinc finger matrin-type protein 3 n=1 Tax=Bactrocera dorsalis TaxID=27457 RepID=A0A6I9V777_BACDO|nr:zinc finger matrin-type protein 3 [Bactrocera dorsalis]
MSNEFLAGYHIPTIPQGIPTTTPVPFSNEGQLQTMESHNQYQNFNRYIPPGLQGISTTPLMPPKPLKRKYDVGPGSKDMVTETSTNGQLVIFYGRDVSYPEDLNKLLHPLHCTLCGVQMNSSKSAKDHYESKQHDRHITNWLKINYTEKGLSAPTVKRFIKDGPSGPDSFHCEVCDLNFGSLAHASQHYAGRKHKLVMGKISQPSGSGYYNAENKWVRTGTKFIPKTDNDNRFGIGELFKQQTDETAINIASTADTTTTQTSVPENIASNSVEKILVSTGETLNTKALPLHCEICKINVTSEVQMAMHLKGIKHKKKLKTLSIDETLEQSPVVSSVHAVLIKTEDTILESLKKSNPSTDFSMYRTPSGSYYCECCNMSMCHLAALQQHLTGKKHMKKVIEVKDKAKTKADSKL